MYIYVLLYLQYIVCVHWCIGRKHFNLPSWILYRFSHPKATQSLDDMSGNTRSTMPCSNRLHQARTKPTNIVTSLPANLGYIDLCGNIPLPANVLNSNKGTLIAVISSWMSSIAEKSIDWSVGEPTKMGRTNKEQRTSMNGWGTPKRDTSPSRISWDIPRTIPGGDGSPNHDKWIKMVTAIQQLSLGNTSLTTSATSWSNSRWSKGIFVESYHSQLAAVTTDRKQPLPFIVAFQVHPWSNHNYWKLTWTSPTINSKELFFYRGLSLPSIPCWYHIRSPEYHRY